MLQVVESTLHSFPDTSCYLVAFSGGRDSHVLLYLMAQLRERNTTPLAAVHVHHGLQDAADTWCTHCEAVCRNLNIPIEIVRINAHPSIGQSPEDAARQARYAALAEGISPGGMLLTAHHQDDQAETVLLQLLRGSGPEGLSAMPICSEFSLGLHVRPLLDVSREEIEGCAQYLGLDWIEDTSNQDCAFDRNRLRHDIVPLLKAHWPAFSKTLARSARHCAEASVLIRAMAAEDLERCGLAELPRTLSIESLNTLSGARQAQVLRLWVRKQRLQLPTSAHIEQIRSSVLTVDLAHHSPQVSWGNVMVRAWRGRLYLGDKRKLGDCELQDLAPIVWPIGVKTLLLPDIGCLKQIPANGVGVLRACLVQGLITVRFRNGGERCRLPGEKHHRRLKQLLQDSDIPPWERARLPLIYIDDELAAVADRWVCAPFAASEGDEGVRFVYEPG